jgi:hypothetical protein
MATLARMRRPALAVRRKLIFCYFFPSALGHYLLGIDEVRIRWLLSWLNTLGDSSQINFDPSVKSQQFWPTDRKGCIIRCFFFAHNLFVQCIYWKSRDGDIFTDWLSVSMHLKVKLILCCKIFIFVRVLHFYDFTNIDKVLHNCIRGLFIRNVETMRFGRDCKVKSVARICCKLQLKITSRVENFYFYCNE